MVSGNRWRRLGWGLIVFAISVAILMAGGWLWIWLADYEDKDLSKWAALANIVALPFSVCSLIVGIVALVVSRKEGESTESANAESDKSGQDQAYSTNGVLSERIIDRTHTYIEVHPGASYDALPNSDDLEGDGKPADVYRFPHLQTPLALKVTISGESQEMEFYDQELAMKWIAIHSRNGNDSSGASDGEWRHKNA